MPKRPCTIAGCPNFSRPGSSKCDEHAREFHLDGDMRLRFHGERDFLLNYSAPQEDAADELFAIARRYGFFSSDALSELESLEDRTASLLDEWDARPLTVGVPESDIASEASALASEWDEWIRNYAENPLEARADEATRQVLLVVAEVASNPTNPGIDDYNAAVRRMNKAVNAYNQGQ
jgi:hypothetical protein